MHAEKLIGGSFPQIERIPGAATIVHFPREDWDRHTEDHDAAVAAEIARITERIEREKRHAVIALSLVTLAAFVAFCIWIAKP